MDLITAAEQYEVGTVLEYRNGIQPRPIEAPVQKAVQPEPLRVGDAVEIYETFGDRKRVVVTGNADRITKSQIVVRDAHGNIARFRIKDNLQVGYAWPQLTTAVRRKE